MKERQLGDAVFELLYSDLGVFTLCTQLRLFCFLSPYLISTNSSLFRLASCSNSSKTLDLDNYFCDYLGLASVFLALYLRNQLFCFVQLLSVVSFVPPLIFFSELIFLIFKLLGFAGDFIILGIGGLILIFSCDAQLWAGLEGDSYLGLLFQDGFFQLTLLLLLILLYLIYWLANNILTKSYMQVFSTKAGYLLFVKDKEFET